MTVLSRHSNHVVIVLAVRLLLLLREVSMDLTILKVPSPYDIHVETLGSKLADACAGKLIFKVT